MAKELYAGVANAHLDEDQAVLPGGLVLSRDYLGLFGGFFAHLDRVTPDHPFPDRIHPVQVDIGYEITAQILIPSPPADDEGTEQLSQLRLLCSLLRLICAPEIHVPVYSSVPLAEVLREGGEALHPFELLRHSPFRSQSGRATLTSKHTDWLKANWDSAHSLFDADPRFRLAIQAFDSSATVRDLGLYMLGLWSGLEALFSPSGQGELRFRLSSTIDVYLEPPGQRREALQRKAANLYDVRSKITHGVGFKNFEEQVVATHEILQKVLAGCIKSGNTPDPDQLSRDLLKGV